MIKKCLLCGKEFTAKKTSQKFDSVQCRTKYHASNHKEIDWRECLECGTIFNPSRKDKIFCSRKCKVKYHSAKSKDKRRFGGNRQFALEMDDFKCALCGETENLAVHHRDKSGNTENPNNDPVNLITLCNVCHTRVHNPRLDTTPHEIRTCSICGIEYRVSQVRIDDGRGKFCSKECFNKSMEKKVPMTCEYCGKEFFVTPSRAKRGKVKYDSMECRKAAGYAWTGKKK